MGEGLALLEERLTAKRQAKAGFDPASIIAIIQAIIAMIGGCKSPTPAQLRRRLGNRARLAAAGRQAGMSWTEAFSHADDAFDEADKATDPELQTVIDDCK